MKYDISQLLSEWDYQPGQVVARRFKTKDGVERLQLRVDLGILQMNAVGRPDGRRPMGHETWHACQLARLEKLRADKGDEADVEFELAADDCAKLQQEAIQYHHRYICFFQLEDYAAVIRDTDRNLDVFSFVDMYAATPELAWSLNQFAPQLLMMRTRAEGTRLLKQKKHLQAIEKVEAGIEALERFYRDHEREDLLEGSGEIQSLRQWLVDIRNKRPVSQKEKLQRQLAEAIQLEDYEKAARVRDQLRKITGSES